LVEVAADWLISSKIASPKDYYFGSGLQDEFDFSFLGFQ
jgi:hypothetical protein